MPRPATFAAAAALALIAASCERNEPRQGQTYTWPAGESARIDEALAPASPLAERDGLAAAILIDVSTSMARAPRGATEPKIVSAKQAALDLVDQFARYAADHPEEPVMLGIYEFSTRRGMPAARPVVPMAPPDRARAEAGIDAMRPDGDTPIGEAIIAGKQALDSTGLTRRHLLVITDGENTDSYDPGAVAAALGRRPPIERPSLYFVAFDINATRFTDVKGAGALVLEAADSRGLAATIESLLTGQILVER